MEDLPVKAIVIGVSVFVTMAVLSAILMYFNTARGIADTVSNRTDIADSYDSIMNSDNFEDYLTGVEVRSLITKYVGSSEVKINIIEISGMKTNSGDFSNVNNNSKWLKTESYAKIIRESVLDIINPVWNCKVEKVKNGDNITLNIRLDVEK